MTVLSLSLSLSLFLSSLLLSFLSKKKKKKKKKKKMMIMKNNKEEEECKFKNKKKNLFIQQLEVTDESFPRFCFRLIEPKQTKRLFADIIRLDNQEDLNE